MRRTFLVAASIFSAISAAHVAALNAQDLSQLPPTEGGRRGFEGANLLRDALPAPSSKRAGAVPNARRSELGPGEVEIAQYGQFEDIVTFSSAGFKAVRFDPPFDPPYSITKITFPSLTMNGVSAVFPSVRLCELNTATGRIDLNASLFRIAPFVGSPDGLNEIAVDLTVTESGKIFFFCVEFPSTATATFPNDFPFLRMDFADTERGLLGTSYEVSVPPGTPHLWYDRNIIASMFCRLPSADIVPIEAPRNLGANWLSESFEFRFRAPDKIRADGSKMPPHSHERTDLLRLEPNGQWVVVASTDAASDEIISVDADYQTFLYQTIWATQAVDTNGRRSLLSNVVRTNSLNLDDYDSYEPNGKLEEAAPILTSPTLGLDGSCFPAGDQDFYSFNARPGDIVQAFAGQTGPRDGYNDLDLVMFLYDSKGKTVASDDNSGGLRAPQIVYCVPPRFGASRRDTPEKFTLQISDIRGSRFSPNTAPQVMFFHETQYHFVISLISEDEKLAAAGHLPKANLSFGSVLSSGSRLGAAVGYVVPQSVGSARVVLRVFDVRGRHVRTLIDRTEAPGLRTVLWDGADQDGRVVSSGTYYARLEIDGVGAGLKITICR